MPDSRLQRWFKPLKTILPGWISQPVRSVGTAVATPIRFSWRSGHFRSSFARAAVTPDGAALPWYTYPCIDFLRPRSFADKTVIEFGIGQSTYWWASRAKRVIGFEGDSAWFQKVQARLKNTRSIALHLVPDDTAPHCVAAVRQTLSGEPGLQVDIAVIDGLWRAELIETAISCLAPTGIIICDNAEGYGFYEGFRSRGFQRVDFVGYAPGVSLPHCTSIFFRDAAWLFSDNYPIAVPSR
jgi:hypothetical protein